MVRAGGSGGFGGRSVSIVQFTDAQVTDGGCPCRSVKGQLGLAGRDLLREGRDLRREGRDLRIEGRDSGTGLAPRDLPPEGRDLWCEGRDLWCEGRDSGTGLDGRDSAALATLRLLE